MKPNNQANCSHFIFKTGAKLDWAGFIIRQAVLNLQNQYKQAGCNKRGQGAEHF